MYPCQNGSGLVPINPRCLSDLFKHDRFNSFSVSKTCSPILFFCWWKELRNYSYLCTSLVKINEIPLYNNSAAAAADNNIYWKLLYYNHYIIIIILIIIYFNSFCFVLKKQCYGVLFLSSECLHLLAMHCLFVHDYWSERNI